MGTKAHYLQDIKLIVVFVHLNYECARFYGAGLSVGGNWEGQGGRTEGTWASDYQTADRRTDGMNKMMICMIINSNNNNNSEGFNYKGLKEALGLYWNYFYSSRIYLPHSPEYEKKYPTKTNRPERFVYKNAPTFHFPSPSPQLSSQFLCQPAPLRRTISPHLHRVFNKKLIPMVTYCSSSPSSLSSSPSPISTSREFSTSPM